MTFSLSLRIKLLTPDFGTKPQIIVKFDTMCFNGFSGCKIKLIFVISMIIGYMKTPNLNFRETPKADNFKAMTHETGQTKSNIKVIFIISIKKGSVYMSQTCHNMTG
jgi:hypothetical protein